jgi:hypothetical protein
MSGRYAQWVAKETTAEYRLRRFRDLLAHDDFAGNQAKLGKALGWASGAIVWQILEQRRPVTEKLIDKIESLQAGRYAGWFSDAAPTSKKGVEQVHQHHQWPLGALITPERWAGLPDQVRAAAVAAAEAVIVDSLIGTSGVSSKHRANGAQ